MKWMTSVLFLLLLLLSCSVFAQSTTKPAPTPPPIPESDVIKFQQLVILQKDTQRIQAETRLQFLDAEAQLKTINDQGLALEKEILTKLGLDPTKFVLQYKDNTVVIVPATAPKPTEKK